jgi:predicted nucleic acid-binding protein
LPIRGAVIREGKSGKEKICMKDKIFLDTNILVYLFDNNFPKKKLITKKIIKAILRDSTPFISTQVMQEFYVTLTKKLNVDPIVAKEALRYFENFDIVNINEKLIAEAIDCSIINQISFGDSLIVVAAESVKCNLLYSEDLNEGQIIRGIKVINPYSTN